MNAGRSNPWVPIYPYRPMPVSVGNPHSYIWVWVCMGTGMGQSDFACGWPMFIASPGIVYHCTEVRLRPSLFCNAASLGLFYYASCPQLMDLSRLWGSPCFFGYHTAGPLSKVMPHIIRVRATTCHLRSFLGSFIAICRHRAMQSLLLETKGLLHGLLSW